MAKNPVSKKVAAPPLSDEVSWTVRMPRALAEAIKARAGGLTAEGGGRWSGNLVIVVALTQAVKTWEGESAK